MDVGDILFFMNENVEVLCVYFDFVCRGIFMFGI